MIKRVWKVLRKYLVVAGIAANMFLIWMAMGWPIVFDRFLIRSEKPIESEYVICLTGGVTGDLLPLEDGWQRIYTAVQLFLDGYGQRIVFTGGGTEKISEAEIYAEAARWLGCPESAIVIEPTAGKTADHPRRLMEMKRAGIDRDSPLNIVTTSLYSRRTALCFKKAGFRNFKIVTDYSALKTREPEKVRALKASTFKEFKPSGKSYDDILNKLKWRLGYFFSALREIAAIIVYKTKGLI